MLHDSFYFKEFETKNMNLLKLIDILVVFLILIVDFLLVLVGLRIARPVARSVFIGKIYFKRHLI